MRFKRLGASLLTGALSLSMLLAPSIPVLAKTADYDAVNATYGVDGIFIDKDENVVYKYTKKQLEEMKENNTKEYRNLKAKLGADPVDNLGWLFEETKIAGKTYYVYTETTYKNTITGKSSKDVKDVTDDAGIPKTITVNKGAFYSFEISLGNGNVSISKLKSSKPKIATAVIESQSQNITNQNKKATSYDKKKKKYYYTDPYGKRIYTNYNTIINRSNGTVKLRIQGLKNGTSVISFNILDKDGNTTKKNQKIKVKVKDTQPFASFTYAGKNLIYNPVIGALDKDYIYYGKNRDKDASNNSSGYTTTAKGKLSVKMNKNYKLIKIEVGSLYQEKYKTYTRKDNMSKYFAGKQYETKYSDEEQFNEYSGTIKSDHYCDLNGDGDYLDTVNGIREDSVDYKFTTVKNNSTIKLSKITDATTSKTKKYNSSAWKRSLKRDAAGNALKDEDENELYEYTLLDKNDYTLTSSSGTNMYAPTLVNVTYYDKADKNYKKYSKIIWYRVSKK